MRSNQPADIHDFQLTNLKEGTTYYLVCEYRGTPSYAIEQKWYQTRLPFEVVKSGEEYKIWVKPGELEFKEVYESGRINAFPRKEKPK